MTFSAAFEIPLPRDGPLSRSFYTAQINDNTISQSEEQVFRYYLLLLCFMRRYLLLRGARPRTEDVGCMYAGSSEHLADQDGPAGRGLS